MKKTLFGDTKQLAFMALMFALSILFVYTLGMLPAAVASLAVLTFIPCMLTGILYGVKAGALMGALTGLVTLSRAIIAPASPLDVLFINPLISVLPRIFVGVVPCLVYRAAMKVLKKNEKLGFIAGAAAGFMGSVTNTALVMLMLYFVYAERIIAMMGTTFRAFLITIITTNAIIEAFVTSVLLGLVCAVYFKLMKKSAHA